MLEVKTKIDTDLLRELLARLITRNTKNPIIRASERLLYLRNVRDLDRHPDRHLAGAIHIADRSGATFEVGLQIGACAALCACMDTPHYGTLVRMLADVRRQQDDPHGEEETNGTSARADEGTKEEGLTSTRASETYGTH